MAELSLEVDAAFLGALAHELRGEDRDVIVDFLVLGLGQNVLIDIIDADFERDRQNGRDEVGV